ncbi:MAG: hypothetical protein V4736_13665 [Bdellovibrionota bacterium]
MVFFRFFLFFMFFNIQVGFAQEFRRQVNLEWETIEGATSYDLEVIPAKKKSKVFNFTTKSTTWQGQLNPGQYSMRLRAKDYRSVPGDWSPDIPFTVGLDPVKLEVPTADFSIPSQQEENDQVKFQWAPTRGAKVYLFEIHGLGFEFNKKEEVKDTHIVMDLPVAHKYTWSVTAMFNDDIKSEKNEERIVSVVGKKLVPPKIEKPENDFVRKITWSKPDNVEEFEAVLYQFDEKEKKWIKFQTYEHLTTNELPFDETWAGGKYQLQVKSINPLRQASNTTTLRFPVRRGSRDPAAEHVATVRRSIDRVNGYYGIASYMITQVDYKSAGGVGINFATLAGTGRVGMGYLTERSPWGFLGIIDYSGITFDKGIQNYSSMEANAVYQKSLSDTSEMRYMAGLFNRELPILLPNESTITSTSQDYVPSKGGTLGPHGGLEYWYSMTPKLGFQLNGHVYLNMVGQSMPANTDFKPSMSYQVGALGSYRVNNRFTGLMGVAHRTDTYNFIYHGTQNIIGDYDTSVNMTGTYFNLFAEYDF